jgi:hypothetical protein
MSSVQLAHDRVKQPGDYTSLHMLFIPGLRSVLREVVKASSSSHT